MRMLTDKPVGFICLTDDFCLAVYGRRPRWLHRKMLALVFGLKWRDAVAGEMARPASRRTRKVA